MSRTSGRCCAFRPRSFSHLSVRRRSYCYFLAWSVTACARSFTESRSPERRTPPNSARFLNSTSAVALQNTNATHGNRRVRERQYNRYGKHRCYHSNRWRSALLLITDSSRTSHEVRKEPSPTRLNPAWMHDVQPTASALRVISPCAISPGKRWQCRSTWL
jgi:hypothetical protein